MENEVAALAAVVVAAVGGVLASVQRQVVLALVAFAVALFALADVVKGL